MGYRPYQGGVGGAELSRTHIISDYCEHLPAQFRDNKIIFYSRQLYVFSDCQTQYQTVNSHTICCSGCCLVLSFSVIKLQLKQNATTYCYTYILIPESLKNDNQITSQLFCNHYKNSAIIRHVLLVLSCPGYHVCLSSRPDLSRIVYDV